MSAIKPFTPYAAPPEIIGQARENCAVRLRLRGQDAEAESFAMGQRDDCWATRHEIRRLLDERGSGL